ncbi:MAG: CAP domain-containing protein [bacterium]|nr:CAP domain-containing protein [bacterium]
MLKSKIIIVVLVLAALAGGFLFRDTLFGIYNNFGKTLEEFKKTELGTIISEIGREILAPPPLNIGGPENATVLNSITVVLETNNQRNANGLASLKANANLNAAATAKAKDMFAKQYFEHVSPEGVDPGTLVKRAGYDFLTTGENLILGNFTGEKEVVQLWMNSPGHRANILNTRFTEIGVAVLKGSYKGEIVWIGVQEFGLPFSSCPKMDEALKSQIQSNKAQLDVLSSKIDAKREEIENTGRRSEKYNQLVDEYDELVKQHNELNDATGILISKYNTQVNNFNKCVSGS